MKAFIRFILSYLIQKIISFKNYNYKTVLNIFKILYYLFKLLKYNICYFKYYNKN